MRRGVKVLGVVAVAGLAAAAQAHGGPMGPRPGGRFPGGGPIAGGPHGGRQGGLQGGNRAPDARHAAHVLARAADADASGDVLAAEWAAFLGTLNADATTGVVDMTALAAALPPAPPNAPADGLTRLLDQDGDGVVTLADLEALFALLDVDGDGALSSDELAPPAGGPGAGDGEPAGPCMVDDARRGGFLLARAADADGNRGVSSDEWTAFLASMDPDGDGVVDLGALAAALPAPHHAPPALDDTTQRDAALVRTFDYDGDGVLSISDLQSLFDALDKNDDGAASKGEARRPKPLGGRAKQAVLALVRAADADASRDVSAAEWAAFLDGLVVDGAGAVSLDDLASKLPAKRGGAAADTTRRDAALVKAFDKDGDGVVTRADLQAIFDMADGNADGALGPTELRPKR